MVGDSAAVASESSLVDGASRGATAAVVGRPHKRVVGFGSQFAELYGLGSRYDFESDLTSENARFEDKVSEEMMPELIRSKKVRGAKPWLSASQLNSVDQKKLAERAKKINRTRLNYAGMSSGGGL